MGDAAAVGGVCRVRRKPPPPPSSGAMSSKAAAEGEKREEQEEYMEYMATAFPAPVPVADAL